MCLVVIFSTLLTVFYDLRLLGLLSARYGGGVMMALILFSGWYGLQVIRRNQDPEEMMRWAAISISGDERARPEDALMPMVRILGGFLLLIPGPLTDLIGLALLSPVFARPLAKKLMARGGQPGVGGGPFGGMGGGPFGGMGGGPFGGMGGGPFSQGEEPTGPSVDEPSAPLHNHRRRGRVSPAEQGPQSSTIIDVSGEVISTRDGDDEEA